MKIMERISDRFEKDLPLQNLFKILLVLLIIVLLQTTGDLWKSIFYKLMIILRPFVFGFAIAYVLRKPVYWGDRHRIPKPVMITVLYVLICVFLYWLISSLVPMILGRATGFINSMIDGLTWLYKHYESFADNDVPVWVRRMVEQLVQALNGFQGLIPDISGSIPDVINGILSTVTNTIFTVIISLFMCFQWDKIRFTIIRFSRRHSRRMTEALFAVNDELTAYLRSMLLSMAVKFVEYAVIYKCIGNQDWLILALLTSIGLIVPYIGPSIANVIGILTSLSLPVPNIVILIVLILVLSNVDEYVITPILRARTTSVTPLWALFSIYAGGTLFGIFGIVVAIPVFLSLKAVLHLFMKEESAVLTEEPNEKKNGS